MSEFPSIVFEQPLFQSERIAGDWARMRSQITSITQLEAAYRVIEPEATALRLSLSESDSKQVLELYNKAVIDGRFLGDLITDPGGVAAKVRVPLSEEAAAAIKRVGSLRAFHPVTTEPAPMFAPVAIVAVAIILVIAAGPRERASKRIVVDSSGIVKL